MRLSLSCLILFLGFLVLSVQAAPTFEWVPVRANGGAFTINGNEITLTDHTAPAEVELGLRLSGWGTAMGHSVLNTYVATVYFSTLSSGFGAPLVIKGRPEERK